MSLPDRLLVVDGNGLVWILGSTLLKRTSSDPDVLAKAIFYAFTKRLIEIHTDICGICDDQPMNGEDEANMPIQSIIVVFDGGASKMREALYPDYKLNRHSRDRDGAIAVYRMMNELQSALREIGANVVQVPGVEADDTISILTNLMRVDGRQTVIISEDRDMYQCLGPNTFIYTPKDKRLLSRYDALAEFGGDPHRFRLWKALAGDTGDNIPGISGIGEDRAKTIVLTSTDPNRIFNPTFKNIVARSSKTGKVGSAFDGLWKPGARQQFDLFLKLVTTATKPSDLGDLADDVKAALYAALNQCQTPNEIATDAKREFFAKHDAISLMRESDFERVYCVKFV